jgi:hypothetical protein
MAGLTTTESQATLDARFPTTGATDQVRYSVNGTTEFAGLAPTAIGATGWSSATAADPSVKANASALTSAAATAAGTVSHFAVYSTGGAQRTDWTLLTTARTVAIGDQLSHAAGAISITLT